MVENRATIGNSHTIIHIAAGLLAVVALTITACGTESDGGRGNAQKSQSDNPGLRFAGTYRVDFAVKSVNGAPPRAENGSATGTFTWFVQSTCDGPGNTCVAVAAAAAPDPQRPLNLDRMKFVFENNSWTRVFVPNRRECISNATKQPVSEPWVAMHTTTLATPSGTGPLATLTGTYSSLQGGTCGGEAVGDLTLTRTGDVPAGTAAPADTVAPAVVADPPGRTWRGTYNASTKPVSASSPSFMSAVTPGTERFSVAPVCTRTGDACVAPLRYPGKGSVFVYSFVNGGYERSYISTSVNCTNGQTGYIRRSSRYTAAPDASSPAGVMTNRETVEFLGGCPGSVRIEGTAIRTGD